jgi:hypothetical protein
MRRFISMSICRLSFYAVASIPGILDVNDAWSFACRVTADIAAVPSLVLPRYHEWMTLPIMHIDAIARLSRPIDITHPGNIIGPGSTVMHQVFSACGMLLAIQPVVMLFM